MSGKALIPGLLLLLAGGGCSFLLRGQADEVPPAPAYRDSLNVFITNALSELPELKPMDQAVDSFMDFWSLHGVSLAVMRNDSLVYAKGYGMADDVTPMTPGTTLRIASVSKLLTAIGVMKIPTSGTTIITSSQLSTCCVTRPASPPGAGIRFSPPIRHWMRCCASN